MKSDQTLPPESAAKVARLKHVTDGPGALRGQAWLTVQTHQAQQLIRGRRSTLEKPAIIGLVGFADRLRAIWQASRDDDPYADWWLIKVDDALEKARDHIRQRQKDLDDELAQMQAIDVTVATSMRPYRVQLQFANPYAYQGAQLIAEFDTLVRTILTCRHIGLLEDVIADAFSNLCAHKIRGAFSVPHGFRSLGINRKSLQQHSAHATKLMGELPEAVLSGDYRAPLVPRKAPSQKKTHRPTGLKSLSSSTETGTSESENPDI